VVSLTLGDKGRGGEGSAEEEKLLRRLEEQLREYALGQRRSFDVNLRCRGTPFQQQVWQALGEIPYGERRTYGQISAAIGRPGAARAVGAACAANEILLLIPCHRVVGAQGALTGFSARGGVDTKRCLLELEQSGEGNL
jgi:methylated-DNA-[protein]-cysteine S-methyltransferase